METYLAALAWLEASWLGEISRNSAWVFTIANLLHVLGAALAVGAIAVFDVRVLSSEGWRAWETGRFAIPIAAVGLALQIPTGIVLLAVEARALGVNPAFYAKVVFIAVGLANVAAFHALFGRDARAMMLPSTARVAATISLGAWVSALLAGRMIAYL